MSRPNRIVIAGAGISGLSLAHELRKRGADPLVFEGELRAGGKVCSRRAEGFLCEDGPTGFIDRKGVVTQLARELSLSHRIIQASGAARNKLIADDDKLRPVSPKSLLTSKLLSASAIARALCDVVLPRGPAARGGDESVAEFARRRFGRTVAAKLFSTFVGGIYAGDADALSLSAAMPGLAEAERKHRSILLATARQPQKGSAPLLTFQDGMQELPAALAAALNGRLHLGASIRRVLRRGECYALEVEQDGHATEVLADAVVLAVPAHAAGSIVAPVAPEAVQPAGEISYAPIAVAHLGYGPNARVKGDDAYGFLVAPVSGDPVLGATYASSIFPHATTGSHRLFSVRLGGMRNPDILAASDAELIDQAHTKLERLLGVRRPPWFAQVIRHAQAIPQYTLGHRARLESMAAAESAHPGLFFHGNAYRGVGLPDCVASSVQLAARILN